MEKYNILIIDDEKEIVDLIRIYLRNEGFGVFAGCSGAEGLEILDREEIHLVLLDIMLPGSDGIETCRTIRESKNIPIIMISAKSQDMDKILGLGTGADDYMTKPFNPMELTARVRAQIRRFFLYNSRTRDSDDKNVIEIRGISIDKNSHSVTFLGRELNLTPTEYEILSLLAGNPGTVFSAEEIFRSIWKQKYFDSNNTVMVHMWRLREKIEPDPRKPEIITTVWGVGYKIDDRN